MYIYIYIYTCIHTYIYLSIYLSIPEKLLREKFLLLQLFLEVVRLAAAKQSRALLLENVPNLVVRAKG